MEKLYMLKTYKQLRIYSIIFCCFFVATNNTMAQIPLPESDTLPTFNQIQDFFYSHPQLSSDSSEEGGIYARFKRWEWFWGPRLYPSGNFSVAANAIRNYAAPSVVNTPSLFRGIQSPQVRSLTYPASWEALGPIGMPNSGYSSSYDFTKGNGRLQRIAFDPTNPNTQIYVAAPSGGLWKSTDVGGTITFSNTSTSTDQLPLIGVADVAIDPNDGENIFIAMGDGDDDFNYSIGMYRSTDGGSSWSEVNSGLFSGVVVSFKQIKKFSCIRQMQIFYI
jgi:hypothetical protein